MSNPQPQQVSRAKDYMALPVEAQRHIFEAFAAAYRYDTPEQQLSRVLALAFGMAGFSLLPDIDPERISRYFDEAARAAIGVMAPYVELRDPRASDTTEQANA